MELTGEVGFDTWADGTEVVSIGLKRVLSGDRVLYDAISFTLEELRYGTAEEVAARLKRSIRLVLSTALKVSKDFSGE